MVYNFYPKTTCYNIVLRCSWWSLLVFVLMHLHPACSYAVLDDKPALRQRSQEHHSEGTFRGLSVSEFNEVREFVLNQTHLRAEPSASATLNSNYIFLIEDYLPKKKDILHYRNQSMSIPDGKRRAKVVLFMGAESPKAVREYVVYPVPSPRRIEQVGKAITWKSRPLCRVVEEAAILRFMDRELPSVRQILNESFGHWVGDGCKNASGTSKCLMSEVLPRATPDSNERYLQVLFYISPESVEGYYLYPVSFKLVLYTPNNGDQFAIRYVYYNDVRFSSLKSLRVAYKNGNVSKIPTMPYNQFAKVYGSPKRRGEPTVPLAKRPPKQVSPDGQRFDIINGRHVNYLGWSFDVYFRTVSGLQLFNVKYMGVDVAFEVGMQTIAVLYGASEPENMFRSYYDDGFVLGALTFPLMKGFDCPPDAVYLNSTIYSPGSDGAKIVADAACIFEHVNSVPLRRHYDDFAQFSMPDTVLVVRQVLTVSNYDYIFDYEFHQTGVIETKVSPTGYVAATNDRKPRYGFMLNRDLQVNGNVHVHTFNFKFDIDVAATANRLVSIDLESEKTSIPLSPNSWPQLVLHKYLISTEKESVNHYKLPAPKYYVLQSPSLNAQGYRRGYRVLSHDFTELPIKKRSPFINAVSWLRQGLAVTVHKEEEPTTASLYTQSDPFHPVVDFDLFLEDNENIVDQDLVVWASATMHHFPSAEDIPVTTTPGKTLSVQLAPFNFFNEDPSIASHDASVIDVVNQTFHN